MENEKKKRIIKDEVTGVEYVLKNETPVAKICAVIGIFYLIGSALFLLYLLITSLSGDFSLVKKIFNISGKISGEIELLLFAFIGGALGSIIKEIRAFIFWHCENKAYGKEFFWKVVSSPIFGGILAIFIYAVLRSGVLILGAEFNGKTGDLVHKIFSIFAISFLTGFGSEKAIKWINYQVKNLFNEALKKEKKEEKENKKK